MGVLAWSLQAMQSGAGLGLQGDGGCVSRVGGVLIALGQGAWPGAAAAAASRSSQGLAARGAVLQRGAGHHPSKLVGRGLGVSALAVQKGAGQGGGGEVGRRPCRVLRSYSGASSATFDL